MLPLMGLMTLLKWTDDGKLEAVVYERALSVESSEDLDVERRIASRNWSDLAIRRSMGAQKPIAGKLCYSLRGRAVSINANEALCPHGRPCTTAAETACNTLRLDHCEK